VLPIERRTIHHGNEQWTVREADARKVPGAKNSTCLICESVDVIRRVWQYPSDWQSLSDDELWQLLDDGSR
jgi:hypothetical protein